MAKGSGRNKGTNAAAGADIGAAAGAAPAAAASAPARASGAGRGSGAAGPGTVNAHLGALVVNLNPYANNKEPHRGQFTGPVDIYMRAPPTWPLAGAATMPTGDIGQVQVEMESNYPAEWTFKGQSQKVYKTARIKYRYPVLAGPNSTAVLYWIEDYMLVGYEGGPA